MSDGGDAAHLDEPVRRELLLSDDQRIARIDRDRWIGYGRALEVIHELERILRSERRQRPDNLLIVGASNNGKTAIARRFMARVLPPERRRDIFHDPGRVDPGAERAAYHAAVDGNPCRPWATARAKRGHRSAAFRGLSMMRRVGLRLLLIDDLHNIRGSGVGPVLVELREIGSVAGVSLGCFATREIAYALRQDEQLANRFELMTLPRWQIDDPDYWRLLQTFGRRLPLRLPSNLTDPTLAADILVRCDGLIGGVTRLLRQAAVQAVRLGHERIDRTMFDRVRSTTPAAIEALSTSERF